MPDIAMCNNTECKQSKECYRFTAKPSFWQSYCGFAPVNGKCDHYWPNNEKENADH